MSLSLAVRRTFVHLRVRLGELADSFGLGGRIDVSDEPGFGLVLNPKAVLIPADRLFNPDPERSLGVADEATGDL